MQMYKVMMLPMAEEDIMIRIIGLEPHPEDKKNGAYDRISLSDL